MLASASPRRRDLLTAAGLTFEVEPSHADEDLDAVTSPEAAAVELARRKARAVAAAHAGEDVLVLGADTVVALGPDEDLRLLAKPADEVEARAMLEALSGSRHRVVTGVAVVHAARLERPEAWRAGFERTWVSMRALTPAEVSAYVASGEWRDKAGGYAIQETADAFVTALEEGGFDNVVGLPVALARRLVGELEGPLGGPSALV
ncbi:MAG: septum formation protein Maf [Planctomycetes bacterium]|nr:septum formation protein Maf [Planctomycetota bacterium]